MRKIEQFQDKLARLFPQMAVSDESGVKKLARTVTFQVTDDCNLHCSYCVDGNTDILMSDYSTKKIKDVNVGDFVLGFDEITEKNQQTKIKQTEVLQTFVHKDSVIKVTAESGEVVNITSNHKVLVRRNSSDGNICDFIEAGKLRTGSMLYINPMYSLLQKYANTYEDTYDYKVGYVIGMMLGDGSCKKYKRNNSNAYMYKIRLAVKDSEIIDRMQSYCDLLDIHMYQKDFKISTKYNVSKKALFANTEIVYEQLNKLFNDNLGKNNSYDYYRGFLAGIYDAEGSIGRCVIRIANTDLVLINEIKKSLTALNICYVEDVVKKGVNMPVHSVRVVGGKNSEGVVKFLSYTKNAVKRKGIQAFINRSSLLKTKVKSIEKIDAEQDVYNIATNTHTYIANGIAVHNCYQINKGHHSMPFDVAKRFIDMLLSAKSNDDNMYINTENSPGLIIEFIGGEPFLEIDLMDKITDYFISEMLRLQHPWATRYMISICSNGLLYFNPKVQAFLEKHKTHLSFSITIDGNKKLHDSCRVRPDGTGSYDTAIAGVKDWMSKGRYMGSKMTIAPANVMFTYDAVRSIIESGYDDININCVYEEGWTAEHAKILYDQLKLIADYMIDNDLVETHRVAMFEERFFHSKEPDDNDNWCGGTGAMISVDYKGDIYPCIRYMESSLGTEIKPITIGNVYDGILTKQCERDCVECMRAVTRRSQSTDECFNCPIAEGCSWCSAYNYQTFGTVDKRATFICIMHKARCLGNVYFWNKWYRKTNQDKRFKNNMPDEWSLSIIDQSELDMLKELEKEE